MFSGISNYLGLDMGSSQVRIYQKDKIILSESSVAAVDSISGTVLGFGTDALIRFHSAPGNYYLKFPVRNGVISDYDMTKAMLRFFVSKALHRSVSRPVVMAAIPSEISSVTRHALVDALVHAGAQSVYLIPSPAAAAIGSGMNLEIPSVSVSLVLGRDVSDAGIYSCGGIVSQIGASFGGHSIDLGICQHIQNKYNMFIGLDQAEKLKCEVLSLVRKTENHVFTVRGRRLTDGVEVVVEISVTEMASVMQHLMKPVVHLIKQLLHGATPEMADDLLKQGLLLSGGSARIDGISEWLSYELGIPVKVPPEPESIIAKGCYDACLLEHEHSMLIENGEKYYGGT